MASPIPITGNEGILKVWDGAEYKPIGCLTSYTIDQSMTIIESNTKCNPNVLIKLPGTLSYTVSCDGEYIDTTSAGIPTENNGFYSHDWLMEKYNNAELLYFNIDTGLVDTQYYGMGYITSLSLTQGSGDELSTFSVTFDGSDKVSTTDLVPSGT